LSSIVLYDHLRTIDNGAFLYCEALTDITLPNTVTTLGEMAFAACRKLNSLQLSNSLTEIGSRAFAGCYELKSVNIPNSVKTIGERAFEGSDFRGAADFNYESPRMGVMQEGIYEDYGTIEEIVIGSSVDSIGQYAFVGSVPVSITVLTPEPPVLIQGTAASNPTVFEDTGFETTVLYVPRVLVDVYKAATEWEKFTHIEGIEVMGNGDSNGDGQVTISDVTVLINYLLSGDSSSINRINVDINGDGNISISDVTLLINKILSAN